MPDETDVETRSARLRRAALWAMLGGASGVAAWSVVWATDGADQAFNFAPGTTFALVVGLACFGMGYVRIWQVALFVPLSVVAWYAGFYVGAEHGYYWSSGLFSNRYLEYFSIGMIGGTVWAVVQTVGVALFLFARRLRLLLTLAAAGTVTAGLLVAAEFNLGTVELLFLFIWTGWYAVYAAILSTALPPVDWTRAPLARLRRGAGGA